MKSVLAEALDKAQLTTGHPAALVTKPEQFIPVPADRCDVLRQAFTGEDEDVLFEQAADLIAKTIEGVRSQGSGGLDDLRELAAIIAAATPEHMLHNSGMLVEEWTSANTMLMDMEADATKLRLELAAANAKAEALESQAGLSAPRPHNTEAIAAIVRQATPSDHQGSRVSLVLASNGTLTRVTL